MSEVQIIPYDHAAHREACIGIFNSNRPKYFADHELVLFSNYLDREDMSDYFVLVKDGEVLGCGGYFVDEERNRTGMAWGMIHQAAHGRGLGTQLTTFRIDLLREKFPYKNILCETSQHTKGFYEHMGFIVRQEIDNGWAEGLHKIVMELPVTYC